MCGIFGSVLKEGRVAPIIHDGLKRLEYRGYDSVGFATIDSGVLQILKDKGRIDDVVESLGLDKMPGSTGVGHTRWATHGAPEMINAHPHSDCEGRVAVIHNGVIENFMELKEELLNRGHNFTSRTDTEVIAHLIEEEMKGDVGLGEAVLKALRFLEGSYAVAVVSATEPDKIYCARNESPLVLGVSDTGTFCASDVPAILPYTNKILYLRNGEFAELDKDGFTLKLINDGSTLIRAPMEIDWTIEMAEKQGYPYFMLKEMYEQPSSLRNALRLQQRYLDLLTTFLDRGEDLFLVAAGTSYYACIAASYMFSKLARLTIYPVISSEFVEQYGSSLGVDSVVLAVSQSGETYDTLQAVEHARMRAATVIGVTNTVFSSLCRRARAYISQQSGPEIGVAATKTFTSQLMVLSQLAMKLARTKGKISQDEVDELEEKMFQIPDIVEQVLERHGESIGDLVNKYVDKNLYIFLGRGISSATALEGRLKLLELTYVPSLAYPAGESKHGPISVVEEGVPVVFVCPRGESRKDIVGSIMEMKARGAKIISVCEEGDKEITSISDDVIAMPMGIPDVLSPIPYVVPLQLFAYHLAVQKSLDPDKPRNLAKSVTVP
ncbi:MAG: glutamine--fructose-6-phosphate transaminase (isomerizing) [Candidatus Bathyarchaeota archaeon]|nr:MAG: glutamine--fructose-6-phosphate transaminase (isomerizing) [Candidatus Bathyarchaeota archaeon]